MSEMIQVTNYLKQIRKQASEKDISKLVFHCGTGIFIKNRIIYNFTNHLNSIYFSH